MSAPPGVTSGTRGGGAAAMATRRAPSKMLPIVVAAGLAVGVFGGLIVIYGASPTKAATNSDDVAAELTEVSTGGASDEAESDTAEPKTAPDAGAAPEVKPENAAAPDAGSAVASADASDGGVSGDAGLGEADAGLGSADGGALKPETVAEAPKPATPTQPASGPTNGSRTPSSAAPVNRTPPRAGNRGNPSNPVAAAPKEATFQFAVSPSEPPGLRITVDGKRVSGTTHTMRSGKTKVRIVAKARGYKTFSRVVRMRDQTVRIRLRRPTRSSSPSGLIDL